MEKICYMRNNGTEITIDLGKIWQIVCAAVCIILLVCTVLAILGISKSVFAPIVVGIFLFLLIFLVLSSSLIIG
ncbi:MAG: hypothetical protein PHT40_03360 [Patescibacteria group bacterium]|nr:hypothetical protein [Patescibacteria group bacterium]